MAAAPRPCYGLDARRWRYTVETGTSILGSPEPVVGEEAPNFPKGRVIAREEVAAGEYTVTLRVASFTAPVLGKATVTGTIIDVVEERASAATLSPDDDDEGGTPPRSDVS